MFMITDGFLGDGDLHAVFVFIFAQECLPLLTVASSFPLSHPELGIGEMDLNLAPCLLAGPFHSKAFSCLQNR